MMAQILANFLMNSASDKLLGFEAVSWSTVLGGIGGGISELVVGEGKLSVLLEMLALYFSRNGQFFSSREW